jgi:alkylated DNA repair dioxygenase AlkB
MTQLSILGRSMHIERFDLPDADVRLVHGLITEPEASRMFRELRSEVAWRQDKIRFYGKEHNIPRLQQWYGDAGMVYKYSGIEMRPEPWSSLLLTIKQLVEGTAHESDPSGVEAHGAAAEEGDRRADQPHLPPRVHGH